MRNNDILIVEDEGPIRHLRFNRPERLNAISLLLHERVLAELEVVDSDPDIRVVAFSGEGRAFCSGDDMRGNPDWAPAYRKRLVDLDIGVGPLMLNDAASAIRKLSKVTVALMHGHALGAGFDYSLSCDFRVAADDLNYGDPRIFRGMWAAEGWSYKLPRQLNQSLVTPICYLGEQMTAAQALDVGLVHRVYPAGEDLRVSAADFLSSLAALDPGAYLSTKQRMIDGLDMSFEQALNHLP